MPVYTLIPYELDNGKMVPGPFHGYADYDDWRSKDPLYRELVDRMSDECDNFYMWRPECMDAGNLAVSPSMVKLDSKTEGNEKTVFRYRVDLDDRSLYSKEAFQAGTGHKWVTEHFCKSIDDAVALFEAEYENALCETKSLFDNLKELGDRGLPWVTIPSPVMSVCRIFDPQDFLLFSALYKNEIMKFMGIAYERTQKALVKLLDMGAGPIIRFGGAEHATPPMMSPDDFDSLVYDYDKPLMDLCHDRGRFVAVHCHGNIKHAVKRFMDMGVDQIDPVEALPWGDISLDEVRKMTNEQITLTGNIQFSEITDSTPEAIRKRVRDIIKTAGPERLIISTTGTPPEKITRRQFDNYNAMIDAVIEYG
ncbi:MAG: uroporphyrinogen decarboxylase family protein [Clostridia bacterium]|nr:uroporphyrinogen decarboxylase family protein [Clostridia bacterium]